MKNELKEKAKVLAIELQKLLEENLPSPSPFVDGFGRARKEPIAERVQEIYQEIQAMGFIVSWEATIDPKTLAVKVDVTIWEPKKDLSPKDQKNYDEWFMRVNGIM